MSEIDAEENLCRFYVDFVLFYAKSCTKIVFVTLLTVVYYCTV